MSDLRTSISLSDMDFTPQSNAYLQVSKSEESKQKSLLQSNQATDKTTLLFQKKIENTGKSVKNIKPGGVVRLNPNAKAFTPQTM